MTRLTLAIVCSEATTSEPTKDKGFNTLHDALIAAARRKEKSVDAITNHYQNTTEERN